MTANDRCQGVTSTLSVIRLVACSTTLLIMGISAMAWAGHSAETRTDALPVLVELFTSEGCSTCPPTDAMLEQMDTQPLPGAQLIVLSEHVDYWDHDGWKDPYSSSSATDRQKEYVRALGLNTVYTPQIIVDGTSELQRGDPERAKQQFQKVLAAGKIPVRITSASVETRTPAVVRGRIEVDGNFEKNNADIFVVLALDHAESQVLRGENGGKHLRHVAVVQELKRIAKLEKGKNVSRDFELKLKPGTDPANLRIVAFVQETGPGRVLGVALRKL
ncbi:MAG TPA: DUF1223 domain-containing protein [Candidatus Saccharimonadales bacterium]|nr:DUF1223 domain-containing protein [Candidatus Saccharimonadales bacterium]